MNKVVSALESIAIMGLWIELATYFGMWWLALVGILCVGIIRSIGKHDA